MPETTAHLAGRLASDGERTLAFFQQLTPEQWERCIYPAEELPERTSASGKEATWSAHQILAHIVSAEASFMRLIGDIAAGGSGAPIDFNIDSFNNKEVTHFQVRSRIDLLNQFAQLRQANARLVAQLDDNDLVKTGRHPYLGMAPLADIIKLVYRHNQIHLRDIRQVTSDLTGDQNR